MTEVLSNTRFADINRGYGTVFRSSRMTIGLVLPLDSYDVGETPNLERQTELVQLAEELGFAAVWLRDIPFDVPSFGDVGQVYDPFVFLGFLAGQTSTIALGTSSIVLPLRHPAHVAKAAASVDQLSGGRLLMGIASGDRPDEYPAMKLDHSSRGAAFRESYDYIRQAARHRPRFSNKFGTLEGTLDIVPKPSGDRIPLLFTGGSQQSMDWLSNEGDGWLIYPRPFSQNAALIREWREQVGRHSAYDKPIMQPINIDLQPDDALSPQPIPLGIRSGPASLVEYVQSMQAIGVDHLALNLRFNSRPMEDTLRQIAKEILPALSSGTSIE